MSSRTLLLSSLLVLAACSSSSSDQKDESESTEQDISLRQLNIVGDLTMGQTTASTRYSGGSKYVAFKFAANTGDKIDIWVKSSNGDPIAWILDNDFRTIAKNDDAAKNDTNSHIELTTPANKSATHYLVVRDYWSSPMKFTASLAGQADFAGSCTQDSDCVRVAKNCCSNLGDTAVMANQAAAYKTSLACAANPICPAVMPRPSDAMAQCNRTTSKCELVEPKDIKCGGHVIPAARHDCPANYECTGPALAWDGFGSCQQHCGGFAGIQCRGANEICQDNPNDECDAANGAVDCGGLCVAAP